MFVFAFVRERGGVNRWKQNLTGVLGKIYIKCIKCSPSIKIQSTILILIRFFLLTKTDAEKKFVKQIAFYDYP